MSMIEALPWECSEPESTGYSALPHILLVIDQFPETLGGGERTALKLAANLPKYGFRASILTFFVHPNCVGFRPPPCPIYLLPLKRTYDLMAFRGAYELRRFLRAHQVRITHTFFESSDLWAGFVTKTMSDAKLVWSRRDMGILRERKHAIAYRVLAAMPNAVLAVSEQVRQHCIAVDRIDPKRVETVYNGLDLTQWEESVMPSKRTLGAVVTTVGNIRRVKGHDLLISAAAKIAPRFPDVMFSVAGAVLDENCFVQLEAMVRSLNLTGRFQFAGAVSNLRWYLSGADIFVLPSRSEGFSNAIIEAMAAGLPVVATDVGGNAEAVEHGVSGIIVPPDNPDALAEAIAELLADTTQAKAMGAAGKAIVAERFSDTTMMNHIADVYRRVLGES